jgi:hypothetical protein
MRMSASAEGARSAPHKRYNKNARVRVLVRGIILV